MKKIGLLAVVAAAAPLAATAASAPETFYRIDSATSTLSEVRRIGGALIPEIGSYSNTNPFLLDPQDPKTWPLLSATFGLWNPANPTALPPIVPQVISVGGTLNVVGGSVTEASIQQLGQLSLGTFQSFNFDDNVGVISDMQVNGLTWTYDPLAGTLRHGADPGNAECVPAAANLGGASGVQVSGQCGLLRNAVNSAGGNSWVNWTGINAGYTVFDTQTAPYHQGTGGSLLVGPQSAVEWDLTDFVEGVGGIVRARVTSSALGGNNASAFTADRKSVV